MDKELLTSIFIGFCLITMVVLSGYALLVENKYNKLVVDYNECVGKNTWNPDELNMEEYNENYFKTKD